VFSKRCKTFFANDNVKQAGKGQASGQAMQAKERDKMSAKKIN
jgi:hypothetical protein